jgi:hypothetical protein
MNWATPSSSQGSGDSKYAWVSTWLIGPSSRFGSTFAMFVTSSARSSKGLSDASAGSSTLKSLFAFGPSQSVICELRIEADVM